MDVNKIKVSRRAALLTQKEVAEKLGICYRVYMAKENGKTAFTFDEVSKVVEIINSTKMLKKKLKLEDLI